MPFTPVSTSSDKVASVGQGFTLGYNTDMTTAAGPATTYTVAATIKTIGIKRSNGEVENVLLNSTGITPYLVTLGEGTSEITGNFIAGAVDSQTFVNLLQTQATAHWEAKTAKGSTIQWDGFFTDFSVNYDNKTPVDFSATIRWTADMIFTPSAT